jgi:Arc/MetJ-type ribon-helix-helix transcriptional regulator
MKTLTVRLPEAVVAQIEAESRARRISKSDIVRERLSTAATTAKRPKALDAIRDLIGIVDAPSSDISENKKLKLKTMGYGSKRPR